MVVGQHQLTHRPKGLRPTAKDQRLPCRNRPHHCPESSAPLAGTPLYRWFYDELRSAILEGRIAPGARLPATRDLAREYKLARATVVTAFEQLKSEGYVEGRVGAGTYVSQVLPDDLLQVGRTSRGQDPPGRGAWAGRPMPAVCSLFRGGEPRITRAFRANQAALDVFPTRSGPRWSPGACVALRRNCCRAARRWDTVRCARRLPRI